ncbi:MAG: Rv1355c family protein [Bacteroidetes bacterium]|nr:MAG: Rv1355c family protein [Bacteroidota bacterium]
MNTHQGQLDQTWEPDIFPASLLESAEPTPLKELLKNPQVEIHDSLESQISEMLKAKFPAKKLKNESLKEAVSQFLVENPKSSYGNWVYYPWSRRLIRMLPEEDFIFTRTSPNVPKITRKEQAILHGKTVGVVGLSVGQSISLVLAMERICNELRIADFDELELANLNRIRSGVHNIGVNKAIAVAREIKEIDPYFRIQVYTDGLTMENMDDFFHKGGDLDLIVDECDSIDIKLNLRKKAKSLAIPVVMDMSDRGTIDVERFDLEPERPIMHGWLEHLDYSNLGKLTNEEKVPFMMPIFGIDTISKRLKASMVEIGQTIHTWPQLATAVAMGGALAADTVRRIFLDQFRDSGRYFIDLDQLISDQDKLKPAYTYDSYDYPELDTLAMQELAKKSGITGGSLDNQTAEELVKMAGNAPSAGNNQPWKWLYFGSALFLFHDKKRSYSWTDHDDSLAFISLGAAIESMKLAAEKLGLKCTAEKIENSHPLIAAFRFEPTQEEASVLAVNLLQRCSNRKKGDRRPFDQSLIPIIQEDIASIPGARFDVVENSSDIAEIGNILARAEKIRFLHPQGHHEFFGHELRWNREQVESTRDGLDILTYELAPSDVTGLEVMSDPAVLKLINDWKGGKGIEKVSRDAVLTSSAIGIITLPEAQKPDLLLGGQAAMRAWIRTNMNGWAVQPISAPLFFINRIKKANHLLTTENVEEIRSFEKDLIKIIPILQERRGIFMFRISFADKPTEIALRRPVEEILIRG